MEFLGILPSGGGTRLNDTPRHAIEISGPGGRDIYQAALEVQFPDLGTMNSLIGIFEMRGSRMKLRISYPPEDPGATLSIRQFLEEFR